VGRTINGVTQHVTRRDQHAKAPEDMFDFDHSPSLNTEVGPGRAACERLHATKGALKRRPAREKRRPRETP
jgi:hypothetical protein